MRRLYALLAFVALASVGMAARPKPAAGEPPPSKDEQQDMLGRITRNALASQDQLPDFICTQRTRRSEDRKGKGKKFKLRDTLEVEFTYIGGQPNWKLVTYDGRPTQRDYKQFRSGFVSDAILQFFSLPDSVFGEKVHTQFAWNRWDMLDRRRVQVFSFIVPAVSSQLALTTDFGAAVVGFHGLMYADAATETMVRLEVQLDLPRRSAARDGSIDVDYGSVEIAGREFLLPVKAVAQMRTPDGLVRNETEVVRYRKYTADSSVTFGAPDH